MKAIVDLCIGAGCSPIEFNQGVWVLGSRIAKDIYFLGRIANGYIGRVNDAFEKSSKFSDSIKKFLEYMSSS